LPSLCWWGNCINSITRNTRVSLDCLQGQVGCSGRSQDGRIVPDDVRTCCGQWRAPRAAAAVGRQARLGRHGRGGQGWRPTQRRDAPWRLARRRWLWRRRAPRRCTRTRWRARWAAPLVPMRCLRRARPQFIATPHVALHAAALHRNAAVLHRCGGAGVRRHQPSTIRIGIGRMRSLSTPSISCMHLRVPCGHGRARMRARGAGDHREA